MSSCEHQVLCLYQVPKIQEIRHLVIKVLRLGMNDNEMENLFSVIEVCYS